MKKKTQQPLNMSTTIYKSAKNNIPEDFCIQPSSDPPSAQEYWGGGMETTGEIHQMDITENSLFYCSQVT